MSIMTQLSLVAVRFVVSCTLGLSEDTAERAIGALIDFYGDPSKKLPNTIERASDRAWTTLEIAFAGDTLWNRWTSCRP